VHDKGVFDLLRSYGDLDSNLRQELSLVFVGDGAARQELEKQAMKIHPGRVDFVGFLQGEQLARFYALAEMFVLPTHSDTWGLVVNEAMACGLPIICTDVAGCVRDLVQDGWNGITFPAGNTAALTGAMMKLSSDGALRCLMGSRSKERILRYSPEACASGIAEAVLESRIATYV
jgi:glycosyltransferase involved in cell wall biosynthesis